jgi:hypothetical protein
MIYMYLKLDVLLLTDVFENFIDLCLENSYGLDPVWYYTTPGLAWDCMLKYTSVELELLTDYEMYFFLKRELEEVFHSVVTGIRRQMKILRLSI